MKKEFKMALCQMRVVDHKGANLARAVNMVEKSAGANAELVVLPEMFNCPYDTRKFGDYAEEREDSRTLRAVSAAAQECGLYMVAGSIPEKEGDKIYNTSFIFNPSGEIIGAHRKLHLFDIDLSGEVAFTESETLTSGQEITVLETDLCTLGVAVCYDLRFIEIFRIMALRGAELMVIPGAFNLITGPAHWENLIRARAIDNQVYVAAASPARDENASYVAYGHSMVADPWGKILRQAGVGEEILYAVINPSKVEEVRNNLPVIKNRRTDLYDIIEY